MSDIAEKAGVSRMAVSHVLMGTGKGSIRVSESTAERIRQIANELGYVPNRAAQQLAGKKSGILGIIANDWLSPLEVRAFSFAQHYAQMNDFRLLVSQANRSLASVERFVAEQTGRGIDGLLFVAHELDALWPSLAEVLERVPNVVTVLGRPPLTRGFVVDVDYAGGIRQAVDYLHKKGRHKIVLTLERADSQLNRLRSDAFCNALNEFSIPFSPEQIIQSEMPLDMAHPTSDTTVDILVDQIGADAVLADDDYQAASIIRSLSKRGLKIPQDIAVVGAGNFWIAPYCHPNLTTIHYSLAEVMAKAIGLLHRLITRQEIDEPAMQLITPKLVVRDSA